MKHFLLLSLLGLLGACGNPVKILKEEIAKSGHMMYQSPIAYAGTGTLIGGAPNRMMYVANPQTCFNDAIELPVKLRHLDHVELPSIARTINVQGNANVELFNILGAGASPIGIGANFSRVKSVSLSFEDVQLEYLDAIAIKYYYDNVMDQVCKDFLDQVGFITQAIKVGKMKFQFTSSNGSKIALSTPILKDIISIGAGVSYQIENTYSLVITSPKYLGYQLGQLRKKDAGYTFYRSTSSKDGRWVFNSINVFGGASGSKALAKNMQYSSGYRMRAEEASIVGQSVYMR